MITIGSYTLDMVSWNQPVGDVIAIWFYSIYNK